MKYTKRGSESNSQRMKRLRKTLEEGRIPDIRVPLPGAEELLRQYGYKPGVDVYVPDPALSHEDNMKEKAKMKGRRRYKKERERVGKYTPRENFNQKERKRIDGLKDRIMRELAKEKGNRTQ